MTDAIRPNQPGIRTTLAYDGNKNEKVEPEEVVRDFAVLKKYDSNGDDMLKEKELKGLYYEMGKDKWAPADRPCIDTSNPSMTVITTMKSVNLKDGTADISMKFNMGS